MDEETDCHIKHSLCETNSPRPLFPKISIKRELNLLEKIETLQTESSEDTEVTCRTYMFSQLLKDLDELCELQTPYLEQQIDEISENLSVSNVEEEEEAEAEPDYVGISFLRTNDYSWNFSKKEEVAPEPIQPSDDETESDSKNESSPDVRYNIRKSFKEKFFIYFCSDDEDNEPVGRWSSRDVHDVKFNEDKLSIQFKIGRLGAFGLAINWYSNLPFQTWELRPDKE